MNAPGDTGSQARSEVALFGAILVFGINYPVLKGVVGGLSPFLFNALRFTASILVLGVVFYRRLRGSWRMLWENRGSMLGLALLGYFLSPVLLVHGLEYTTAANAALILAGAPVWTALVSRLLGIEELGWMGWLGLVSSTVGMLLVGRPGAAAAGRVGSTFYGDVVLMADAIIWGSYVALQRRVLDRVNPLECGFWSLVLVVPVFFVLGLSPGFWSPLRSLTVGTWVGIVFSGIFAMGFARVWWNVGLRSLGPTTASLYGNGIPLISVLVGWTLLGETVAVPQLLGGAVILVGAWMARLDRIARGIRRIALPEG